MANPICWDAHMPTTVEIARCCNGEVSAFLTGHLRDTLGTVLCRALDPGCAPHEQTLKEISIPQTYCRNYLGRPLGHLIFSLMALIRDPIY